MTSDRVSITRRVAAPASRLFAIVSCPASHVQIDGSGMLLAAPGAQQLTAVGQTFDMDMNRDPLGDIPNMHDYKVRNTVTQFIPDRLIEWCVAAVGRPPSGHVYGWQLDPISDTETDVTNYCDWSRIPSDDGLRSRFSWPVVPAHMLEKSLENLERVAAKPDREASGESTRADFRQRLTAGGGAFGTRRWSGQTRRRTPYRQSRSAGPNSLDCVSER